MECETMRTVALSALMISATLSSAAQADREPYTFFKQFIGLQDDQITTIKNGTADTNTLPKKTPAGGAFLGEIYINAPPKEYLKAAENVDALRKPPNYLGVRKFSPPPQLSDLEGFVLDEQDIKDLKN